MKAMILAAGLGTRLRPLTDTRPKALVEINGRTLLEITLSRLRGFGVNEVIINVHHFADMVIAYLKSKNNFGMRIEVSREDDLLLDTGGGLKKAAWFFLEDSQRADKGKPSSVIPSLPAHRGGPAQEGAARDLLFPRQGATAQPPEKGPSGVIPSEARNPGSESTESHSDQKPDASGNAGEPFLLHNVDVISTIDLRRMLQFHIEHRALATLAVQSRESSRLLLFDHQLQLRGRAGSTATPGCAPQNAAVPDQSVPKRAPGVIPSEVRDLLLPPQGTASQPAEKQASTVIPSKARNLSSSQSPNESTASQLAETTNNCHSERSEESAFSSDSPLATRHSPLPSALAFSGIHVISPRLLPMLTEEGPFSIIDAYLRLAAQGEKILAFRADEYYWRDLGRPSDLSQAALDLQQRALS